MRQPNLVIFANHTIDCSCKENFLPCFMTVNKDIVTDYLNQCACLCDDWGHCPSFEWIDEDCPYRFRFYGIEIKVEKHVIQMNFSFLFRAIVDFVPLRTSLLNLCEAVLGQIGTTEMIFCPSYWEQTSLECHTEWGKKRLQQLQEKIMGKAISYKRTKLNITHCLGTDLADFSLFQSKNYRGWIVYGLKKNVG